MDSCFQILHIALHRDRFDFQQSSPCHSEQWPPAFFRSHVQRTSSDSFWQQTILALGHLVGKASANMSWTCVSKCGDPNIVHFWLKVKTAGIAVLWGDVQKGQTLHSCRCCDFCNRCFDVHSAYKNYKLTEGMGMRLARRGRGKVVITAALWVCEAFRRFKWLRPQWWNQKVTLIYFHHHVEGRKRWRCTWDQWSFSSARFQSP